MKSAYELALDKMKGQGIEPPSQQTFSEADRERVAEIRRRAEAKLAELEILHRDHLSKLEDRNQMQLETDEFRRECERIRERRDFEIEKIRKQASPSR